MILPFTLMAVADTVLLIIKGWLVLSVLSTALLCWMFHWSDPRREAGMTGLGHPAA